MNSNLERYTKIKLDNKRVTFRNALKDWPAILGVNIDLSTEPYLSMDKLRDKRNAVIHKKGYFSSIEPAASASTSAVEACKSLFVEFKGIDAFPYDGFIKRYPPRPAPMFSKMA